MKVLKFCQKSILEDVIESIYAVTGKRVVHASLVNGELQLEFAEDLSQEHLDAVQKILGGKKFEVNLAE